MKYQKVRGMKDVLPDNQKYWQFAIDNFIKFSQSLGFSKIDLPLVEETELFKRSLGEETDIVEKELFEIKPKSDEKISWSLRPELTAGCVRAYIENGFRSLPQPVKLYLIGPVYRYDRPQKNRYREFYQLDLEIIGDSSPKYDFLIIQTTVNFLNAIGLSQLELSINSIGCQKCRPEFRNSLLEYFDQNKNKYCPDCQKRSKTNPLRILDCKNETCQNLSKQAPKTYNNLCPECNDHFTKLKELLTDFQISFSIDGNLVRGLDYYSRTVFEINLKNDIGRQSSLAGGGRYDQLFEMLGERSTPAVGVAIGLDRVVNALGENKICVPDCSGLKINIIGVGNTKEACLKLYNIFSQQGSLVYYLPSEDPLSKQLEQANRLKTHFAIIIGEDEVKNGRYTIKDLKSGEQITLSEKELLENLTLKDA